MTQFHVYRREAGQVHTLAITTNAALAARVAQSNPGATVDPFEDAPEDWEAESLYPSEGEGY